MTVILLLSPLLTGLVRKVKARLQRRRAGPRDVDRGDEGGVFHVDDAAFCRGFEQVGAVNLAFQYGGEQADHGFAVDRGALIQPGAIPLDDKGQMAAIHRNAQRDVAGRGHDRRPGMSGFCRRGLRFLAIPAALSHVFTFPYR